jgi:hypothetical protein
VTQILANLFLGCFIVGFVLTIVTLLFGVDNLHGGHDGIHAVGSDAGGGGDVGGTDHGLDHHAGGAPFFSYQGMVIFLTWFGAAGYILNRHASGFVLLTLLGAVGAGFAGAGAVFVFLGKFLMRGQTQMRSSDYYLPGTLARITSTIREGETGEIVYVQGGARKTLGARSEEGGTHPQGEEVVVVRYEKGIAYVKSVADEFGIEQ